MCNNEKYMWQIKQKMGTAHFQGCFIIKYYFCQWGQLNTCNNITVYIIFLIVIIIINYSCGDCLQVTILYLNICVFYY